MEDDTETRRGLKFYVAAIVAVAAAIPVTLVLAGNLLNLGYLSGDMFRSLDWISFDIRPPIPSPTVICTLTGTALKAWYVFLVLAVVGSVLMLAWRSWKQLSTRRSGESDRRVPTQYLWVCILVPALMVLQMLIQMAASSLAGPVVVPDEDEDVFELLLGLLNASVFEEMSVRMLYMGIPMVVVAALYRKRDCLRYLFGGFGTSKLVWVLIVISGLIFGYAHIAKWGIVRLPDTIMMGIVFGYLYAKFGVHVTITIHFIWDFMNSFAVGLGASLLDPLYGMMLLIGLPCLVLVAYMAHRMAGRLSDLPNTGFEKKEGV